MKMIRPLVMSFIILTVLTGVVYPALTTLIGKLFFPQQVAGSLITHNGRVVGSELIGQNFTLPTYFWGRLSATTPQPYNAASSLPSNLGPTNPALKDEIKVRFDALRAADPSNDAPVPVDLVTSSGSGLDPEISLAAANYQVARVTRSRGLSVQQVEAVVAQNTQSRQWGLLGEPRVNVLKLNLALDALRR